jgi:hypothetical protein
MRMTRVLVLAGLTSVIGLAGCGGSNDPVRCPEGQTGVPPNCVPPPPDCTQSTIYSESGPIEKNTLQYFDFSVPEAGRLDMTLDWTHNSSPIGLYLVPVNTCTLNQFNARTCNFLVRSEPQGAKPRKVSAQNLAAGNYRWMIGNFADVKESVVLTIVLSKGECAPLAGAQPSESALGSDAPLSVTSPAW